MEPYEGQEPYIFTSYAHEDKDRVMPYWDALSGAGYRVWYDKGIQAGADWLDTLLEKVENCAVFCPLFSEAFKDSRYCLFETAWAYQKTNKTIVSLYLDDLKKDNLGRFYQHLRKFQELRLHDLTPAQFVERLESETAFAPCKVPEWHKVGQIQWRLSADGVLTIAKNEKLWETFGAIPAYQYDSVLGCSTTPWMTYREKILSVEITDDIYKIGDRAFEGYKSMENVYIGDNVTTIDDHAFAHCYVLTNVRIGDSVTAIGKGVFERCYNLKNVHIPDSVTEIGDKTFYACKTLKDVRIPDNVTKIGASAFKNCVSLIDMRIPDSVTEIGRDAFADCGNLTNVRIPGSVTKIGMGAFEFCESLTDVRIPDSVTKISDLTFCGCSNLMNVCIPDSVAVIGSCAFWGCDKLRNIEIPVGAEVADDAFPEHTIVTRRSDVA